MSSLEPIDEEFTDIELIELSDEIPRSIASFPAAAEVTDATEVAVDQHASEAHARAAQLQKHASGLGELDDAELADHVSYYQKAHADLQRALSDVDHS